MAKTSKLYESINVGVKDFIMEWKKFGFNIAFGNYLILLTMKVVGAKKITIVYNKKSK